MIQYYEDGDVAVFDNLVFRRDKKTGYYLNAKTHKRLHVYVWEYYNGEIPKGCEIHHKDFDKSNNEVDNLQLLTKKDHFCSGACKAANRRKSGVDDETRKCEWCGNELTTNKYSKAKTCKLLRWNKSNPKNRES